ncbi:hypothetical protein [Actinomyces ruminicola]|uniref:Uncharacterized protein n=1 Tax=Actinomyces ruminicola TaxID=332524 RepID=A0A1G9RMQ3_9ACTO|nr:hypothetical protein [Actinomyces ruminicola]SDM24207.1 hypothetical protein SAMN04487766_10156 [Actinomyces ruminicola]
MPEHSPDYPPLRRGWITSSSCGDGTLASVLAETAAGGWQGVAYTTAGACALREVHGEEGDARLRNTNGKEVDPSTVYELRLWCVDASSDESLLARELRWLNGTGGVEVTVRREAGAVDDGKAAAGESDLPCWYRHNSYLQHEASAPYKGSDTMTSIEVFTEENRYGNVVFADELMTGKWN